MKISDLTFTELHDAILALSLERQTLINLAIGLNEQCYKDRANHLSAVIQVLDSELTRRCSDDESEHLDEV